jgi:uncharacterized membrane protein YfcA
MRVPHTVLSRVAVVALCLVAGLLAELGATSVTLPYLVLPITAAAVVTVGSAYKMARDNCFESRLVAWLTVLAALGGAVAAATVGLPGRGPSTSPAGILLVAAALVFLVTVAVEVPRRHHSRTAPSPYAP